MRYEQSIQQKFVTVTITMTMSMTMLVLPSQAEEFDYGGQGIAYLDTDAGKNGGVRPKALIPTCMADCCNEQYSMGRFVRMHSRRIGRITRFQPQTQR